MVLPLLAVGAGVAAASALGQWWTSKEAAKASEAEREKIAELYSKLQKPEFDPSELTPEEYYVAAKYVPETSQFIEEVAPNTVKAASADAVLGRNAQRNALLKLQQNAGNEAETRGLLEQQARMAASSQAQAGDESIRQDFATRGQQYGGGMELLSRLMNQQGQQKNASNASLQATLAARQNALDSLMQSANLGGQIRNEDVNLESKNADIINAFNTRNATRKQGWVEGNVDRGNQAQQYNVGNTQDVANRNVGTKNSFSQYNQQRGDANVQRDFANEMDIARSKAGLGTMAREDIKNNAMQTNQTISGLGDAATTMVGYAMRNPEKKKRESDTLE